MPEFIPQHVPKSVKDDFLRGYLECAEWLLDDDENFDRDKIRGWSRAAVKKAKEDCASFERANGALLARYYEISGRGEDHAGHDFYLSRNGHGAGFFDRGDDPCFDALQEAARAYGETYEDVYRGWIITN